MVKTIGVFPYMFRKISALFVVFVQGMCTSMVEVIPVPSCQACNTAGKSPKVIEAGV